jgi:hypothetical protein
MNGTLMAIPEAFRGDRSGAPSIRWERPASLRAGRNWQSTVQVGIRLVAEAHHPFKRFSITRAISGIEDFHFGKALPNESLSGLH